MIAYNNDPHLKGRMLDYLRGERRANSRPTLGTLHPLMTGDVHGQLERAYGIPWRLLWLLDDLLECLPLARSVDFPEQFMTVIRPGSDLTGVFDRWCLWLFGESHHPQDAAWGVRNAHLMFHRQVNDFEVAPSEWQRMAERAWSAWAFDGVAEAWAVWAAIMVKDSMGAPEVRDRWATWAARSEWGTAARWDARARSARAPRWRCSSRSSCAARWAA